MPSTSDYYAILGVPSNAGPGMIKEAYREAAKKNHPDKYENAPKAEQDAAVARLTELNVAYEVLGDVDKRAEYDGFIEDPTNPYPYRHYRNPASLLYVQRDIDQAQGNLEQLRDIAFSPSEQAVRNLAVVPLLETEDLNLLSRIAKGDFEPKICAAAQSKVASAATKAASAKTADLLDKGNYVEAIRLATSAKELPEIRRVATKVAIVIFSRLAVQDKISDEMVKEYLHHLVLGDLRHAQRDEEHTQSIVPIETRVSIGNRIIDYYKGKGEAKVLLKLEEEKSAYLPRALLGKFAQAAVGIYVEAGKRNELLELLERSWALRGSVDLVINGIITIAQKTTPGQTNDFVGTTRAAIDRLEYSSGESSYAIEKLVIGLIDKSVESGSRAVVDMLNHRINPPQSRMFSIGSRFDEPRKRLPYDIQDKVESALRIFREKEEAERARIAAEALAAKQKAAAEARLAEAERIRQAAAACTPAELDALLTKLREAREHDPNRKRLGREVLGICKAQENILKLEEIALTTDRSGYLVYPYDIAGEAQAELVRIGKEIKSLPLLMKLAKHDKCQESEAAGEAAIAICIDTNDLPNLKEMALTTDRSGYCVYKYKVADHAQAALVKIGKDTRILPLLMELAENYTHHDDRQRDASAAAIELCVETMDMTNLEKMTERKGGYARYPYAERRAEAELKRLRTETGAVATKMAAGLKQPAQPGAAKRVSG
ncbi:J domain-containing protein [Candidatus Micrarchaeota archaeon]|nr:J domain-containing protein [Candidatus Micrarchaeota archaeon]